MWASFFLFFNLGIIGGVAAASFGISPLIFNYLFLIIPFQFKKIKIILLFILALYLGYFRYENYYVIHSVVDLTKYNNQKVMLVGFVSEEIDPGGNYQKLTVKVSKVNDKNSDGLVLVSLAKYPEYRYGDVLKISGKLENPENWSAFRYDRYLARYDIYSTMSWPLVEKLGYQNNFYRQLMSFKEKIYRTINKSLPEPEAGLANALLLGYKGTLDGEEKNNFACCGLSHVIAISGSHLTLLAGLLIAVLSKIGLSGKKGFLLVLAFVWFYTFFTGLQTSAWRSAIMITVTLWETINGRQNNGGSLLFFAGALMLLINPLLLRDDLGFQLSFLAMIALIYFQPLGEKILGQGSIKSILSLTIFSQLLTWPISAFNFGTFSVIAPLANLVVVWLFTWLLPSLLFASVLSLIIPSFKLLLFAPSYLMLVYVIKAGDYLAKWPHACLNWQITWQFMVFYYLVLGVVYFLANRLINKKTP